MSFILFVTLFWVFAVIAILLRAIPKFEIRTPIGASIKAIPGVLAVVFILRMQPDPVFFYSILAIALFFCACGDFSIEFKLIAGLGCFLISHIFYVINFLLLSITIGLTPIPILAFVICLAALMVYIFFYHRYLKTSETEIPRPMLRAVDFYAFMISLTLSASLLLWLSSELINGAYVFLGALFFVISDSMIGIREFHHQSARQEIQELLILVTYYLAIFLLAVGTFQSIHATIFTMP
ncbi:MAG: lysoplasmalogenase [Candidatus Thorarchaeota archaeon]|nr:lysoplasmalogenase [Candidatus Thorarchaeota archaeon]